VACGVDPEHVAPMGPGAGGWPVRYTACMRGLAVLISLGRFLFGVVYIAAPEAMGRWWIGRQARLAGAQLVTRGVRARDLTLGLGGLQALTRKDGLHLSIRSTCRRSPRGRGTTPQRSAAREPPVLAKKAPLLKPPGVSAGSLLGVVESVQRARGGRVDALVPVVPADPITGRGPLADPLLDRRLSRSALNTGCRSAGGRKVAGSIRAAPTYPKARSGSGLSVVPAPTTKPWPLLCLPAASAIWTIHAAFGDAEESKGMAPVASETCGSAALAAPRRVS
jgi:hypothetical protein